MKLLITGANGQLGTELRRQLKNGGSALGALPPAVQNAEVAAVDIQDADLACLADCRRLMQEVAPDAVINCAAFTNVNAAETEYDAAFAANAIAARNMAMACSEAGAKLVHISTDYVFRGDAKSPISEADLPAPNTAYGKTKWLGEQYALQHCTKTFLVRTAWLYGRNGNNFVKTMLRLADERPEIKVVDDQLGNPTNAEDLAHHLLQLLPTEEYGIYHITGGGICSWYQFTCEIMRLAGKTVKVMPCTTEEYPTPAPRPAYSALAHTMLCATIGDGMRPWQQALEQYIEEWKETQ